MNLKTRTCEIKSINDAGEIQGYFSTFDKKADSYGDCVAPGCFTDTINEWKEKGKFPPLVWNHNMNDPELIIGRVDDIREDEHGPLMTAHFYDTAKAQAVRNLVKENSVYQFSFAYVVEKERKPNKEETEADPRIMNVLEKVGLIEVTITPSPANPLAQVTSVKSEEVESKVEEENEIKSGRRTSAKDGDSIKGVIGKLNESISALEALLDDKAEVPEEGEDRPEANAAAEEPRESNPEKDNLLTYIKALEEDSYES